MINSNRLDIFEPGDRTALICMDVPEMQRIVVDQLHGLGYKIHTGISIEDLLLKMRTHSYDVLIIAEHFGATDLRSNPLIREAIFAPPNQRQRQFIALVGASFETANEMQAFQSSVDLVVALSDVLNLKPLIRRGVARAIEFRQKYLEVLNTVG